MPNIYFLDRDGLEYYHDNTSLMFLGKRYNIVFTGDYNVNQTTSARLVLQDELTVSSAQTGIEFPTVSCVATVTADNGYEAGTATITKSGNTFTVNVTPPVSIPFAITVNDNGGTGYGFGIDGNRESGFYELGDNLDFTITFAANSEPQTQKTYYCQLLGETINVPALGIGESYTWTPSSSYSITEYDILEGEVELDLSTGGQTVFTHSFGTSFIISRLELLEQNGDIVIKNTGNLTLTDIDLKSSEFGLLVISSLSPGSTSTIVSGATEGLYSFEVTADSPDPNNHMPYDRSLLSITID